MGSGIERLRPEEIESGTRVPVELIKEYVEPEEILLDVGPGRGDYWSEIREKAGLGVRGLEINPRAVQWLNLRRDPWFAYRGDVSKLGKGMKYEQWGALATKIEFFGGVLAQALFPSLVRSGEWREALRVMDVLLKPGGCLLVADFPRADEKSSYIDLLERGLVTKEQVATNIVRWQRRYEQNRSAFLDLEKWSFAVARPGEGKRREWGEVEELLALRNSPDFERFARHMDWGEWIGFLESNRQYKLIERRWTIWQSRGEGWYPGVIEVWRKPEQYRYHPWKQGLSASDPKLGEIYKERKGSPWRGDYWSDYFKRLFAGLDEWGVPHGVLDKLKELLTRHE